MFTLLLNTHLFSPENNGIKNILICSGKIIYIGDDIPHLDPILPRETLDLEGAIVIPGLIDAHCHITGGGGESGPSSRVPTPMLSQYTRAGVTSVVGVLGTDDLTRNTQTLVTQAYALREEGLSAWCYSGGYHLPLMTLTGSARSDIVNLDPVIGVGELAISDHRSSQPTLDDILRVASETHVAGLMTGKAGILHIHLGDGSRGLDLIRQSLTVSELPARIFHPTHINRNKTLFDEGLKLVKEHNCTIDLTASPDCDTDPGWSAAEGILRYHNTKLPNAQLTMSSDGGGCLPKFNKDGEITSMHIGNSKILLQTLAQLKEQGICLEQTLPYVTTNIARVLRLKSKGELAVGMDADLCVCSNDLQVNYLMAKGVWHIKDNCQHIAGTFENN
jgi:beta-aspartyl-dipeptidase (metallo-type)